MNLLSVDALASATKPIQPRDGAGRTFFKAWLLVGSLLGGGLAAQPADAGLLITTTGTITSGSETGGLFGLPTGTTSLVGRTYTLTVNYDFLGPNYSTTGDGTFAVDSESLPGITGYVIATINGHSVTTPLTNSLTTLLEEDSFDLFASNQGYNGPSTGDFVDVTQLLSCSNACVPWASLTTKLSYTLAGFDFGQDAYTFQGAGFPAAGTPMANFIGTEATVTVVPEPASWVLLATGLLLLSMPVRRRRT